MSTELRCWDRDFASKVDQLSQTSYGIPESTLMNQAGKSCAKFLVERCANHSRFFILVGPGNNGGDGLVCGVELYKRGFEVTCLCVHESGQNLSESCNRELQKAKDAGLSMVHFDGDWLIDDKTVVIDSIFGIGFRGPMRDGLARKVLQKIKLYSAGKVFAVDLPSGMDCNSETLEFEGLSADYCMTFGGKKPCHLVAPLRRECGEVCVEDIGFAKEAIQDAEDSCPPLLGVVSEGTFHHPADYLPSDAHKFDRGHVLVLGGSEGKTGAPILSAMAAQRAGAGWVTLACPEPLHGAPLELVQESFFRKGVLDEDAFSQFLSKRKVRAILVGPGLMEQVITPAIAKILSVFTRKGGRVCLDAAATSDLEKTFSQHALERCSTWATPHPGEWERAHSIPFNLSKEAFNSWKDLEERVGVKILYKSSTPVFIDTVKFNTSLGGDRSLSKAGMGDVFAGILATFAMFDFASSMEKSLQFYHLGMRHALRSTQEHGLLPTDLIRALAAKV